VLPIQPGTKKIHGGFGPHKRVITSSDDIDLYFPDDTKNNLAVVSRGREFILDFDDVAVYTVWIQSADQVYTGSYTEMSPRGVHVFLAGDVPSGIRLVPGVEIKRVALVCPSVVDGKHYERTGGDIFRGDIDGALFSLTQPGTPTPHLLRTRQVEMQARVYRRQVERPSGERSSSASPVERIKQQYSVVDVFTRLSPTRDTLRGSGRWLSAKCPFHKNGQEANPSFAIDTQRGFWMCHTCQAHGDVINLYARFTGRTVQEVISDLKGGVA
jgi:hypothetical protein